MKFYNSVGPNPRMVRMFMAEKGFDVPKVEVDLRGGENRREPYTSKVNPAGQCPALELDDGTVLAEITAICEYVDEKKKDTPSLIGDTPEERAKTRMWTRRIDLNIVEPGANGFRFAEGLKMFQNRIHCIPEAADGLKATARDKLVWLDGLMGSSPSSLATSSPWPTSCCLPSSTSWEMLASRSAPIARTSPPGSAA